MAHRQVVYEILLFVCYEVSHFVVLTFTGDFTNVFLRQLNRLHLNTIYSGRKQSENY